MDLSEYPYFELRGREVIQGDHLRRLRERLGLTRNAMSELLHVSPITYTSWEERDDIRVWRIIAIRVGAFYERAMDTLSLAEEKGLTLSGMIPFHLLAPQLGIPQELLLARYRDGEIEAFDAGILGLWVSPDAVAALR